MKCIARTLSCILLLGLTTPAFAQGSTSQQEIEMRLPDWNSRAFMCTRPEDTPRSAKWDPFPSKVEAGSDPSDVKDETRNCDDRDSLLFGGMLCFVGDERGCAMVRSSQDDKGRWWRSPRQRALKPVEKDVYEAGILENLEKYNYDLDAMEEAGDLYPTTFSHDQANGVFAYVLAKKDAPAFKKWVTWIAESPKCKVLCPTGIGSARYCLQDGCAFKPSDCAKFQVVGQLLGVPIPFCTDGPLPITNEKLVEDRLGALGKLIRATTPSAFVNADVYEDAKQLFDRQYNEALKMARKLDAAIATYSPTRLLALSTISQNLIASNKDPKEYHTIHNILFWILILESHGKSDKDLHHVAVTRAKGHKENSFFEFVAHRKSLPKDHLEKSILKACPSTTEIREKHRRTEWTWERKATHDAWKFSPHRSMYWDCIFIAKLAAPNSTLAVGLPDKPIPTRILEMKLALDEVIRLTVAAGDMVLAITSPVNNPIAPDKVAKTAKATIDVLKRKEPSTHRKAREKAKKYLGL